MTQTVTLAAGLFKSFCLVGQKDEALVGDLALVPFCLRPPASEEVTSAWPPWASSSIQWMQSASGCQDAPGRRKKPDELRIVFFNGADIDWPVQLMLFAPMGHFIHA